jgi:mRNA interferase MazF
MKQMMSKPQRGEVWLIDLGMVAKVRPCLVLSVPTVDEDRVLMTLVPYTTSVRGSRFEVTVTVPFLRSGAFDAQNLVTIPAVKGIRKLGTLTMVQLTPIEDAVRLWLGL